MLRAVTAAHAELCAIALYALPLVAFMGVRARRDTSLPEIALDLPLFVAVDLMAIVVLSCVVPLEVATLVSRPAWIAACAAWGWRRRRHGDAPRWPLALGWRQIATAMAACALAVSISVVLSRHYDMWDRYWHQPQVSAIAMQRIPFVNVFEPEAPLRYHYAADLYASVFRTLSFDVMTATRALALTHDIAFGLMATTVAMLMQGLGQRRWWLSAAGGACLVMHGPIPFNDTALAAPMYGFMYSNYLTNSFRPHVALAGLFFVGYVGTAVASLLAPAGRSNAPAWTRFVPIAAATSLTDETSIAMLGLGLGLAWLVDASVLARRRAHGVAMLVAIAAASVLPSVLFGGSFASGGPVQKLTWAAAHVPSGAREHANLPFPAAPSVQVLLIDISPLLLGCLGILLIATWRRSTSAAALFVFSSSVVAACTFVAMHLEINGQSVVEMQRFFVVPFFAAFVIGLALASRGQAGAIGPGIVAVAVALPAVFSAYWLFVTAPETLKRAFLGPDRPGMYVNCRAAAGAHFGERAHRMYVEANIYFAYSTCRPVFSPGGTDAPWTTKVYPHLDSKEQLQVLEKEPVGPDGAWGAICGAGPAAAHDKVCSRLLEHATSCKKQGQDFIRCPLTPELRLALLKE
jgi:hypothetical protein